MKNYSSFYRDIQEMTSSFQAQTHIHI